MPSPQGQPQLKPPPIHQAVKNSVILHRMPSHTSHSQGRPVIVHYEGRWGGYGWGGVGWGGVGMGLHSSGW